MSTENTGSEQVRVRPMRVEDVMQLSQWGRHTDVRFQDYNFPDLRAKAGGYALNQRLWFHKRSIPWLRWLYSIEDPAGNVAGYFKIVKEHIFQRKAELTMILDPDAMGKRIGSDANVLQLKICFDDLRLEEVWVRVLAFNRRALKSLEKTGFVEYAAQLEPYFDQQHRGELLQSYPEDFSMAGDKLMARFCYLKLTRETFNRLNRISQMSERK